MRATKTAAGIASALFLCLLAADPAGAQPGSSGPVPAPPASAAPAEDGWTMPAKNYASTRYSELAEINAGNVGKLQVAFTFSTGVNRGQEAAPLVVGGTMYVRLAVSEHPLRARPDEARRAAEMAVRTRSPTRPRRASPAATSSTAARPSRTARSSSTRSTATRSRVDAETGKEVVEDQARRHQQRRDDDDGAARREGQGARRQLAAASSACAAGSRRSTPTTGKVVWTAYSTGPDKDVLIGPNFKPFYDSDKGQDLGVKTWPPDAWQQGGGTVWGWISYDPDLNLIYYGTGNPGPWNPDQRPGDNKWTAGIFARDPDTGEARWFYQCSPHDLYDWDGVNEHDPARHGVERAAAQGARPPRAQRLRLRARPHDRRGAVGRAVRTHQHATRGVDLKTGRLQINAEQEAACRTRSCATSARPPPGAKDWNPSAFSPQDRASSTSRTTTCAWTSRSIGGELHRRHALRRRRGAHVKPGPGGHRGEFTAWDIRAGREVWTHQGELPGLERRARHRRRRRLLRHDGRLVQSRRRAHRRAACGSSRPASGIIGQPTTYRGPDGKQYVAILSGVGGWAGAIVVGRPRRRATAPPRSASSTPCATCKNVTTKGGTLYVFRLP